MAATCTMKLALAAYADRFQHSHFPRLQSSARKWGWPAFKPNEDPVKIFGGPGTWNGHGPMAKLRTLPKFLKELRAEGYTHVCLIDSFDTIICNGPESVLPFCNDGALNAAEMACYPYEELTAMCPAGHSRWHHVNGGGLLSNIDFLENWILRDIDKPWMDDQCFMSAKYISQIPTRQKWKPWLDLDTKCEVFQCLAHCGEPTQFFEVMPDGRVRNKETNTCAAFEHGNGRSRMDWLPGCSDWKEWWL